MTSRLALLVLLAGCRFGFEAQPDAIGIGDGDATVAPRCTATKIQGFDFGASGITDLAASQVPQGYAIGAIFGSSSLWGVDLSSQLVPATPGPSVTTPSGGGGIYTNASLYFDGTNLDGSLSLTDGTAFLKTFETDMSTYIVAVLRTGQVGEPSIAAAGTTLYSTWFNGSTIYATQLLADGSPDGIDISVGSTLAPITSMSASSGTTLFIVAAQPGEQCSLQSRAANGTGNGTGYEYGCAEPHLVGWGDGTFDLVYTRGGDVFAMGLIASATSITRKLPELHVGPGSGPRVVRISGRSWVVWRQPTGLFMTPLDDIAEAPIAGAPAGAPDAYEVAGDRVFAVWGSSLYAIGCP